MTEQGTNVLIDNIKSKTLAFLEIIRVRKEEIKLFFLYQKYMDSLKHQGSQLILNSDQM